MGEALTIEARHERGYPIVTVAGEIDIATATRLRERLSELAASGRPLVADLDQVRFIDSAGLAALIGAAKRAAAHGGSLHVVCARPKVRQLFQLVAVGIGPPSGQFPVDSRRLRVGGQRLLRPPQVAQRDRQVVQRPG